MESPTMRDSMQRYAKNVLSGSATIGATDILRAVTSHVRTTVSRPLANIVNNVTTSVVNRYRESGAGFSWQANTASTSHAQAAVKESSVDAQSYQTPSNITVKTKTSLKGATVI